MPFASPFRSVPNVQPIKKQVEKLPSFSRASSFTFDYRAKFPDTLVVGPDVCPQVRDVLSLAVDTDLKKRLLYGWADGTNTGAGTHYWCRMKISLWRNNGEVGAFPFEIGNMDSGSVAPGPPLVNMMNWNRQQSVTLTGPTYALQPWQYVPQTIFFRPPDPTYITLPGGGYQLFPYQVEAEIDRISVSIVDVRNWQNLTVYLGCLSYV